MTTLDVPAIPGGLDARPQLRFTLHCSHCGKPHEGEFGPTLWPSDTLADLERYAISEDGWRTDVDGRALVCPQCEAGWCDVCDEIIYAWQEAAPVKDGDRRHVGCPEDV
jgi:hypothetical protein